MKNVIAVMALCATLTAWFNAASAQSIKSPTATPAIEAATTVPSEVRVSFDYGTFAAFQAVEKLLGTNSNWVCKNTTQKEFLEGFRNLHGDLARIPEMHAAAGKPAKVNQELRRFGAEIQVDPEADFAAASFFKWRAEWLIRGEKTALEIGGQKYAAAALKGGVRIFKVADGYAALISTKTNDLVLIANHPLVLGEDPAVAVAGIYRQFAGQQPVDQFDGVRFPMIEAKVRPDIGFLAGLTAGRNILTEALQEVRFRMDEVGASAEAASAVSGKKGIKIPKWLDITQPLVGVIRPGLSQALLPGYFGSSSWTKAGDQASGTTTADSGKNPKLLQPDTATPVKWRIVDCHPATGTAGFVLKLTSDGGEEKTVAMSTQEFGLLVSDIVLNEQPDLLKGKLLGRTVPGASDEYNSLTLQGQAGNR